MANEFKVKNGVKFPDNTVQTTAGVALTGSTMTGKLNTPAATAGAAGLNIGVGISPTSPVNGDLWIWNDTIYYRSGGATIGAASTAANTFTGTQTFNGVVTITPSTASNTITIGSTNGTGLITLGQSTATQTVDIHDGATTSGNTKTVNIGVAGLSGSTTAINLGSAVTGATNNITSYGTWIHNGTVASNGTTGGTISLRKAGTQNGSVTTNNDNDIIVYGNRYAILEAAFDVYLKSGSYYFGMNGNGEIGAPAGGVGANGQVLTSQGPGYPAKWETVGGGTDLASIRKAVSLRI